MKGEQHKQRRGNGATTEELRRRKGENGEKGEGAAQNTSEHKLREKFYLSNGHAGGSHASFRATSGLGFWLQAAKTKKQINNGR